MVTNDPLKELAELIEQAGGKVTLDPGRSNRHPCTFCGKPPAPQEAFKLVDLGIYLGGETLTRPVCKGCLPVAEAKTRKAP